MPCELLQTKADQSIGNDLVDAYRVVLLMRSLEPMPSQEIAAILGTTEAAVNMRHVRALERMRKIFESD